MRLTRAATTARGERLALAAVVVALFGLMAMHGWGSHSAPSMPESSSPGMPAHTSSHLSFPYDGPGGGQGRMSVSERSGNTEALPAPTVSTDGSATGAADIDVDDDEHHGGLIGICLAILAGFVLAAILRARQQRLPTLPAWLPSWTFPVLIRRDRDPPDPLFLCVVRC